MALTKDSTLFMPNPPTYAQDIQYWPGYGFVAPNFATTNGSLPYLLSCLRTNEDKDAVKAWAISLEVSST